MNLKTDLYFSLFPQLTDPISPISFLEPRWESTYTLKPKDDGKTTIDINIFLSDNNIQNSTSVSYSKELPTESVRALQQLIKTFVRGVEEVYGKDANGSTPKD